MEDNLLRPNERSMPASRPKQTSVGDTVEDEERASCKMQSSFKIWIVEQLTLVAISLGDAVTTERLETCAEDLADIPRDALALAFVKVRREYEYPKLPPVSYIRKMAGAGPHADGRPGPEEAWARMPKGDRMEDDTIVWREEERAAYFACRSLLLEGDQIGARMAFKERYEKELAQARSQGRPVEWTISAGFDVEQRLSALAAAVQEKRISLDAAIQFVPGERRNDFAHMLPAAEAKGLLTGEVAYREIDPLAKLANVPGITGMLARMQMAGSLPEELKADPPKPKPSPLSDAERAERRKREHDFIRARMESEAGHTLTDEEIRQRQIDAGRRVMEREAELAKPPQPEKAEATVPEKQEA
jgi:hypothetical protein